MITNRRHGFTLIELMLVAAIIGLLASISIPKFADLIFKAKEAALLGKLGAVRSAISIYYADNLGRFPGKGYSDSATINIMGGHFIFLEASLVPRYIASIPNMPIVSRRQRGRSQLIN